MRGKYRRGDLLVGAFIASICISLFCLTQVTYSADGDAWALPGTVHTERQGDVLAETYNTVPSIPCEDQLFSKKSLANKPAAKYTACAITMNGAYFENNSSLPGWFRSYSNDTTFHLDIPNLPNPRIFAVPNSRSLVLNSWAFQNNQSLPPGLHIIRDYQDTLSEGALDSFGNKTYTPTKPYDFELRDQAGSLIPISQNGLKFSSNGEWMIFRLSYGGQLAWARINLDTYEILTFATPVQSQFAVYDAISNDGRYAVLYEPQNTLRVYDLARCNTADKFISHQCSYIDLYSNLKAALGVSEIGFKNFRFIGDKKISFFAATRKAGDATWNYGEYTMRYGDEETSNSYLAMGDSFSSGEGAYDYRSQTNFYIDESQYNLCHQSKSSYPYTLSKMIGFGWFGSVACSGAVKDDITYTGAQTSYQADKPQAKDLSDRQYSDLIYENLLPGYREQKLFTTDRSPRIATLTITGNDIGFGDIIKSCVYFQGNCYADRGDREKLANLIDSKITPLTNLLKDLKTANPRPDFRLYMVGYPQIISPSGECGLNVGMGSRGQLFADHLVKYLNRAIELAAGNAGVRYVDIYGALFDVESGKDYRLCGNQQVLAVNGIVLHGTTSKKPDSPFYQESYHPNLLGHAMMAKEIDSQTSSLSQSMPLPASTRVSTVDASLRVDLVGDDMRLVEKGNYNYDISISSDSVTRGDALDLFSKQLKAEAKPGTKVTFEIHSTPIKIGEGTINTDGIITGVATIPTNIAAGYHEIHLLYTNFFGEMVDRYRIAFVKVSSEDYDGDGVLNGTDPCPYGRQAGTDVDKDGIDDACDDEYVSKDEPGISGSSSEKALAEQRASSDSLTATSQSAADDSSTSSNNRHLPNQTQKANTTAVLSEMSDHGMSVTKQNRTGVVELWVAIALGSLATIALVITRLYFKRLS